MAVSGPSVVAKRAFRVGISYGDTLVWMTDARLAAALDDAVAVGASWVRADLSWANIQHGGRDRYRWELFDRVVTAASERGLTVLPVLAYTPPWARPPNCDSPKCAPADPAAFAAYADAAARRYAPRGITTWEVWNEPNLVGFWEPAPAPDAYAVLLAATAGALRAADPSARVILGGLAATATQDGNISATDFLVSVSARGANRVVDAVGYHPYTYPHLPSAKTSFGTAWERMTTGPESLRSVLTTYGTPRLPVWITEVGAPTGGPGTASDGRPSTTGPATTHVTEARQAVIAADAVRTAAADQAVDALIWYSDRDLGSDTATEQNFYGLRRADGSPKPSFAALRQAVAALQTSIRIVSR